MTVGMSLCSAPPPLLPLGNPARDTNRRPRWKSQRCRRLVSLGGRGEGARGRTPVRVPLQALPPAAGGAVGQVGRDGGLGAAWNRCMGFCCACVVGGGTVRGCMGSWCGGGGRALRCQAGRRRAAWRGVRGRGRCWCPRRAVGAGGGGGLGGAGNRCMTDQRGLVLWPAKTCHLQRCCRQQGSRGWPGLIPGSSARGRP